MQTKRHSFIEAVTNTAVGFGISLASTFFIFPFFGIASTPLKNIGITLFFTAISIARGYVLRRLFNKKHLKSPQTKFKRMNYRLHCFECEIDMPVLKGPDNNEYCSNCGLIH